MCWLMQGCASSPHDKDQQWALKQAAEDLRAATGIAASSASKKQIIHKLQVMSPCYLSPELLYQSYVTLSFNVGRPFCFMDA